MKKATTILDSAEQGAERNLYQVPPSWLKNRKEDTMTEKKLFLAKITIQNLDALDRDEQQVIKGGANKTRTKTTDIIVFC